MAGHPKGRKKRKELSEKKKTQKFGNMQVILSNVHLLNKSNKEDRLREQGEKRKESTMG